MASETAPCKIIICCDGTSNSELIENNPLTNVTRLCRSISQEDQSQGRQIVYYLAGIGTQSIDPLRPLRQALGQGLTSSLLTAYIFVCNNHRQNDQLFLIGFSRGAFAARCLADIITQYGILPKESLSQVHRLFQHWKSGRRDEGVPIELRGKETRIKACALWDTVSSIGIPIPWNVLGRRIRFIHSDIECSTDNIFHALALHEYRYHFFPVLLRRQNDASRTSCHFEQCWFAGYHADAGGGNRNDALAHFALIWMMSKLSKWIAFNGDGLIDLKLRLTWRVGGPAGPRMLRNGTYRLPVYDSFYSMNGLFIPQGSKHRIPRSGFRNKQGPYEGFSETAISNETIHVSARFLTSLHLIKTCPAASKVSPTQPQQVLVGQHQAWQWSLRQKARSFLERISGPWPCIPNNPGGNMLQEAQMSLFEAKMLYCWVVLEDEQFDNDEHEAGANPPYSLLIHLRLWLQQFIEINS